MGTKLNLNLAVYLVLLAHANGSTGRGRHIPGGEKSRKATVLPDRGSEETAANEGHTFGLTVSLVVGRIPRFPSPLVGRRVLSENSQEQYFNICVEVIWAVIRVPYVAKDWVQLTTVLVRLCDSVQPLTGIHAKSVSGSWQ